MGDISNLVILNWRTVMMGMVCIPILICAVILIFRPVERGSNRFLGAFLIASVLAVGPQIIGYAGFYNVWPGLTYFTLFSTELWLGPLIYLHADRLMRGGPLGWRKFLLFPGIVQMLYYSWAYLGLGDYKAKWAYNDAFHAPFIMPIENLLTILLFAFAVIAIWEMVGRYRIYLEHHSSAAIDYDPNWLRNLVLALLVCGIVFIGLEATSSIVDVSYDTAFPFQVLIMVIVGWIALEAVWRLSKAFPKMDDDKVEAKKSGQNDSKNWADESQRLREKVLSEAWYLEPRLSIRDLASRMGTNESYVSRTLNQGLGESFNRFINGLRIEHAQKLILDGGNSMLNIAYDSGFNSKATFNRVFKEVAGVTPSVFKKSQNP